MFTLHLSRFLSGRPPAPILQEANVWAHREPYDSVIYCMYWFFVLGFGAPLVAMFLLPLMLLFETAQRNLTTNRQVKARQVTQDSGVPGTTQLAVVITGCDSGIGKELALCLASEGFVVFAGCLKRDSFDHFKGTGTSSIHPVILDVTCDDQVKAFQATVQEWLSDGTVKEKRHLHALVNNAGVGAAGYFDWLELSDYEYCMNSESASPLFFNASILILLTDLRP